MVLRVGHNAGPVRWYCHLVEPILKDISRFHIAYMQWTWSFYRAPKDWQLGQPEQTQLGQPGASLLWYLCQNKAWKRPDIWFAELWIRYIVPNRWVLFWKVHQEVVFFYLIKPENCHARCAIWINGAGEGTGEEDRGSAGLLTCRSEWPDDSCSTGTLPRLCFISFHSIF